MNIQTGKLLGGPNALRPTQPKFWVGHGSTCSASHAPMHACFLAIVFGDV